MNLHYSFFTLLLMAGSIPLLTAQTRYTVSVSDSHIKWTGSKSMGGEHHGTVKLNSGKLVFNKQNQLMDGDFRADMTSIAVEDITGAMADKLSGHLFSTDFFGVESHPTSSFDITSVKVTGTGKANVTGNLTIKGKTHPVTFPATYTVQSNGTATAAGTVTVDRTLYDIRYGSSSVFDNLGDKAISDEFKLDIKLVARRA